MAALAAWVFAVAAGAAVVAGLLIGSVGVGGIIIVPILLQTDTVDVQTAIASAMVSYMAAGVSGMLMYARHNSIAWRTTGGLLLGAAPAAFAGSYFLQYFSDDAVKLVLYALMLGSSVLALYRTLQARAADKQKAAASVQAPGYAVAPPAPTTGAQKDGAETEAEAEAEGALGMGMGLVGTSCRLLVGAITGFGSALTGTSGPVVSLPMFLLLRWPITTSLGAPPPTPHTHTHHHHHYHPPQVGSRGPESRMRCERRLGAGGAATNRRSLHPLLRLPPPGGHRVATGRRHRRRCLAHQPPPSHAPHPRVPRHPRSLCPQAWRLPSRWARWWRTRCRRRASSSQSRRCLSSRLSSSSPSSFSRRATTSRAAAEHPSLSEWLLFTEPPPPPRISSRR